MTAKPFRLVAAPQRDLRDTLPAWQAAWWRWTETGVTAWGREVGTVLWWAVAAVGLLVLSGPALVGQVCRGLVRGRGKTC